MMHSACDTGQKCKPVMHDTCSDRVRFCTARGDSISIIATSLENLLWLAGGGFACGAGGGVPGAVPDWL